MPGLTIVELVGDGRHGDAAIEDVLVGAHHVRHHAPTVRLQHIKHQLTKHVCEIREKGIPRFLNAPKADTPTQTGD